MYSEQYLQQHKLIIGYTTSQHLCIDLDDTSLYKVTKLVQLMQHDYPELGNALIMYSSNRKDAKGSRIDRHGIPRHTFKRESYHVIFNNNIGSTRCWEIIGTLIDLDIEPPQVRQIRARRRDMTLRVSPMVLSGGIKSEPKPCRTVPSCCYGKQDGMIKQYLAFLYAARNLFLH